MRNVPAAITAVLLIISAVIFTSITPKFGSHAAVQSTFTSGVASVAVAPRRLFPTLGDASVGHTPVLTKLQSQGGRHHTDIISDTYRGSFGWRFRQYIPSQLEEDFFRDMQGRMKNTSYPDLISKYQSRTESLLAASRGRVAPDKIRTDSAAMAARCARDQGMRELSAPQCYGEQPSEPPSPELFGRFVYEFVCLGEPCAPQSFPNATGLQLGDTHTSFIEPIYGTMRSPRFFLDHGRREHLQDKEYMIVDKWALHNLHTRYLQRFTSETHWQDRKSIFVDMGASSYKSGRGGSSQNWFVELSDCLCAPFSDLFLFEAVKRNPHDVWKIVPGRLHPGYRWFNYPLDAAPASWRNPLNHLLSRIRPDDVVVVKVDFDSIHLEGQIIDTILQHPELFQTIDELYYEYHVNMAYVSWYWTPVVDMSKDWNDAFNIFRALRNRGIRAHSWV